MTNQDDHFCNSDLLNIQTNLEKLKLNMNMNLKAMPELRTAKKRQGDDIAEEMNKRIDRLERGTLALVNSAVFQRQKPDPIVTDADQINAVRKTRKCLAILRRDSSNDAAVEQFEQSLKEMDKLFDPAGAKDPKLWHAREVTNTNAGGGSMSPVLRMSERTRIRKPRVIDHSCDFDFDSELENAAGESDKEVSDNDGNDNKDDGEEDREEAKGDMN